MTTYKHICSHCSQPKRAQEFYQPDREKLRDGRLLLTELRCITCKRTERIQSADPQAAYARRIYRLQKTYGLSEEDYNSLVKAQEGKCGLCGADCTGRSLCVDHDHATGVIRGLLCRSCNILIGRIETRARGDDLGFADRLLEYFKDPDAACVLDDEVPGEGTGRIGEQGRAAQS